MGTTTRKLTNQLKRRVVAAAKAAEKSPHAFMLEAIEQQTRLDERRRGFLGEALRSAKEAAKTGDYFAATDVHRYLIAKLSGRKVARPKPISRRAKRIRGACGVKAKKATAPRRGLLC